MLEMREVSPGRVALWNDGVPGGGAEWVMEELAWGRERAKVARLRRFDAAEEDVQPLRAYLEYLWQGQGVAAVYEPDGRLTWYSQGLKKRFEEG